MRSPKALIVLVALVVAGSSFAQRYGVYLSGDMRFYSRDEGGLSIYLSGINSLGGFYAPDEKLRLDAELGFNGPILWGDLALGARLEYLVGRIVLAGEPFRLDLYYGLEASANLVFGQVVPGDGDLYTQLGIEGVVGMERVFTDAGVGFFYQYSFGPSLMLGGGDSLLGYLLMGFRVGLSFY